MTDHLSRRSLIKGSIAGAAALAGTSVFAQKPVTQWDETVDVIVIGSGFAGLAAAIEARRRVPT